MNDRGFLLVDVLIALFVVCVVSSLYLSTIHLKQNFDEGYIDYQEEMEEEYAAIYSRMGECIKCTLQTEDLSPFDT